MKDEKLQTILEIHRIVSNYDKQLYAKKFDNLGEMDKFLDTYNRSKLSQEEAESLNRPITTSEIEAVIKKLPAHKSPRFMAELYQIFKEDLSPIPFKLFQKNQVESRL